MKMMKSRGYFKMKSVCIVPIKSNSERVKKKNFRLLNNKPVYVHFLEKLKSSNFDKIYIDTDSSEVEAYIEKTDFIYLPRLPELAKPDANGNDLLNYHASIIDADYYFQLFITAPLLKINTINEAIKILSSTDKYDSIFTANKIYSWFWYNNKQVNYDPKVLPRSQDAIPIIRETTGLYGIKRDALLQYQCRIGAKPYMLFVDDYEAIDLDTEFDFKYLDFLMKK